MTQSCTVIQASLSSARTHVVLTWEATQHLLSDMAAVTAHLSKMGWEVHADASTSHSSMASSGQPYGGEDGGAAVVKAARGVRLQFSYITEALQNQVSKSKQQPVPPPQAQSSSQESIKASLGLMYNYI